MNTNKAMTAYHGGKQKIGKTLAEIIVDESIQIADEEKTTIRGYCEPFCGMLGVYRHVPELFEDCDYPSLLYKGGDTNKSVILMWNKIKDGWSPPKHISESKYSQLDNSPDSALKGYAGHQYSFGGKFFGGYAPKYGRLLKSDGVRNKLRDIGDVLDENDVKLKQGPYTQFSSLKNYVIYCDPPYTNTTHSYDADNFSSERFHDWCRKMSKNNIVFVSEYNAPSDFEKIYSKSTPIKLNKSKSMKTVENLYLV